MPAQRNSWACRVEEIERRLETHNKARGRLENRLADALARRKAERERRMKALEERQRSRREKLESTFAREQAQLKRALGSCRPKQEHAAKRGAELIGKPGMVWGTASEWLQLFKRVKGKRLNAKNRDAVEAMIVALGDKPDDLEAASTATLNAINTAIRYVRAKRSEEVASVRRLLAKIRKDRKAKRSKKTTKTKAKAKAKKKPETAAKRAAKKPAARDELPKRLRRRRTVADGDPVIVSPGVYQELLDAVVASVDPETSEPAAVAWASAVESATKTGLRYTIRVPRDPTTRRAAVQSLEALEADWTQRKDKSKPAILRGTRRVLAELRAISGIEKPKPAPAPAPAKKSRRKAKPSSTAAPRVVASASAIRGEGEFQATAAASSLIDAVDAALRLVTKKRDDRRNLGLLSIVDGRLCVTSRREGGEQYGAARLDCEVAGSSGGDPASIVVHLPELLGALKPLASLELTLSVNDVAKTLVLAHARGQMVTNTTLGESFSNPFLDDRLNTSGSTTLEEGALAEVLQSVLYAASTDDARLNLHGLYIEPKADETVFGATDGHRLALATLKTKIAPASSVLHYNEAKALAWLVKSAKRTASVLWSAYEQGEQVVYRWSGAFKGMHWTLTTRATSWVFPPYRQVVPDPAKATDRCTVRRAEMVRALRIAAGDLERKDVKVTLVVKADGLTIVSDNPIRGTRNQVTVPDWSCPITSGDERTVAVNWRYLSDALDKGLARDFERAHVALFEDLAPIVLRYERDAQENRVREVLALVMPMRE